MGMTWRGAALTLPRYQSTGLLFCHDHGCPAHDSLAACEVLVEGERERTPEEWEAHLDACYEAAKTTLLAEIERRQSRVERVLRRIVDALTDARDDGRGMLP